MKKIQCARENNARMRILTPEEEQHLLAQCSPHLKLLVIAALHTGLRSSELRSLTWDDIDFRRRIITVRAAYAKNGESRSVPMNNVLTSTLRGIKENLSVNGPVFCSSHGTPYRSFHGAFTHAIRKAGMSDFTFHDLRHTFASRLVMIGVDLPTVQVLMGHKTITMTLRYTHLTSGHKQQAVRALETFVEKSQQFSPHLPGQEAARCAVSGS